jgi:hypothetical protein
MLLLYLLLAVLFPSYQGFENGREFHFFEIFKSYAEADYHSQPDIEAPYNRGHSHTLIYFYPTQRLRRNYQNDEGANAFFIKDNAYLLLTTGSPNDNPFPLISYVTYCYSHKSSGLSPPVV